MPFTRSQPSKPAARFGRGRPNLRLPGPTEVPADVASAVAKPMINHRGPEFRELIAQVTDGLRYVFQTEQDVLGFPAAGSGVMEAAIVNCFSPGDHVLAVVGGVFGERFAAIAETFNLKVTRIDVPWGRAADPGEVGRALERAPDVRGVLLTHNETSTGVMNDLAAIARSVRERSSDVLLIVDAVSSLACVDVQMDAWDLDVVLTASQKGWMVPPGLAMVGVSERGWMAQRRSTMPAFYWDFALMRDHLLKGQTPWTPPLPIYHGLAVSLARLRAEGLQSIFERHKAIAASVRTGVRALGLELFAEPSHASDTVTAIRVPDGISSQILRDRLRKHENVIVAGGQGVLADEVFRIGHLGWVDESDVTHCLSALRRQLTTTALSAPRLAAGAHERSSLRA
jgi:aspartate aminotransferase-like enzyme